MGEDFEQLNMHEVGNDKLLNTFAAALSNMCKIETVDEDNMLTQIVELGDSINAKKIGKKDAEKFKDIIDWFLNKRAEEARLNQLLPISETVLTLLGELSEELGEIT